MNSSKKIILTFLAWSIALCSHASEKMWLPHLLATLNESEMREMGLKISAEEIYSLNEGSLKDAIVHFGGFCTAEVISNKGLLLTNHHCGYGQIQSHSTLEKNYLQEGFWAYHQEEELPNEGLYARFILRIEDVTNLVLDSLTATLQGESKEEQIIKNIKAIQQSFVRLPHQEVFIRGIYYGNQYLLYLTERYDDVRLVGAPPSSIGKFGADTDNWVWPRHTGDFALFRIYANQNNLPATYSEENIPYQPRKSLSISMKGIQAGDFTMVYGFPGKTEQYLPSVAIKELIETINPARIQVRDKALEILDGHMRQNEVARLKYAAKFARIANYWKKWKGETLGLVKSQAVKKKLLEEELFKSKAEGLDSLGYEYSQILEGFNTYYQRRRDLIKSQTYHQEVFGRNVQLFQMGNYLSTLYAQINTQDSLQLVKTAQKALQYFERQFKDFDQAIDMEIMVALLEIYVVSVNEQHLSPDLRMIKSNPKTAKALLRTRLRSSVLSDEQETRKFLAKDPSTFYETLKGDNFVQFLIEVNDHYHKMVESPLLEINGQLEGLQKSYMEALLSLFPEQRRYPDANGTLRLTYGQVKGYQPRDAIQFTEKTYLEGMLEKYIPGDYEFDLPAELLNLIEDKDYGPYGEEGKMPLNFIASNHTTGGNSGSPALSGEGHLIGLNFDRVWEGTMSDIYYDPWICRNIMVDVRFILFVIDKYAKATNLIDELDLIWPEKESQE
jgi:hypothetical protein